MAHLSSDQPHFKYSITTYSYHIGQCMSRITTIKIVKINIYLPSTDRKPKNGNMKIINLEKGRKMRKRNGKLARQILKAQKKAQCWKVELNSNNSLVAQLVENLPAIWVDLGSISGLGWCPGEGNGYPLQYSGLENSMDCIVGSERVRTRLSDFHFQVDF